MMMKMDDDDDVYLSAVVLRKSCDFFEKLLVNGML
jgi:hypothetical protein